MDEVMTSSVEVAKEFDMRHDHILRDIDRLILNGAHGLYFESERITHDGQNHRIFYMTYKGFLLLTMGLTGLKATLFKLNYIDRFKEFDRTVKKAYRKACRSDWSALDDIRPLNTPDTFHIHWALSESLLLNLKNSSKVSESDVYEWFKENYIYLLGSSYKIVKRKNDPKHIPDFWLKNKNEFIPVECKLGAFTENSLKQLLRYMDFYGASKGIAVANQCHCELPDNISFIQHGVLAKVSAINNGLIGGDAT